MQCNRDSVVKSVKSLSLDAIYMRCPHNQRTGHSSWDTRTSWKPICALASKTTNFFWTGSQKCLTCSRCGLSFFIEHRPGPTTCYELSDLTWFDGSLKRDCGDASAGSLAQICTTQDPTKLPVSPFQWEVWVEARPGRDRRPIGPVGLTASMIKQRHPTVASP